MEMRVEELHHGAVATHIHKGNGHEEHSSRHGSGYSNVADTPENMEKVRAAVQALEMYAEQKNPTRFQFKMHSETGRIQVALVNYMTGEVVEEIPSSKLLEFASTLEELTGLVMEKKA